MDLPKGKSTFIFLVINLLKLFAGSSSFAIEEFPFAFNDGGRAAAGYLGSAGDCVVRAIAIATSLPYQQVYGDLGDANAGYAQTRNDRVAKRLHIKGSSPRNGNHRKVFHDYILNHGFTWVPTMQIGGGCQVHLRPSELPRGVLIVKVSKHLTAILNGVIQDTHNPSRGGTRCVYGYYIKQ